MNSQPQQVTTPSPPILVEGKAVEIPVEGALGLLALGARGLIAWRLKRDEVAKQQKEQGQDE